MSTETIITVLQVGGYILLGGLSLYLKAKGNITSQIASKAATIIAEAENVYKDATKAGGAKMAYVVDKLYLLVPDIFKPFITRKVVESIVQAAFDGAESYAERQLDKLSVTIQAKRALQ